MDKNTYDELRSQECLIITSDKGIPLPLQLVLMLSGWIFGMDFSAIVKIVYWGCRTEEEDS